MQTPPIDASDPAAWYVAMLEAVAGLQRRDLAPAQAYLRFVAAQRGRPVADETQLRLRRLAASPAFADAWRILAKRKGQVIKS